MQNSNSLYENQGHRLYLTQEERAAFLVEARKLEPHQRTFCTVLHDTGCSISEGLSLPYAVDTHALRNVRNHLDEVRANIVDPNDDELWQPIAVVPLSDLLVQEPRCAT